MESFIARKTGTVAKANELLTKFTTQFPDLDEKSEDKRYGTYSIFGSFVEKPTDLSQFVALMAYSGRTGFNDKRRLIEADRFFGHNGKTVNFPMFFSLFSLFFQNEKLLDLYDKCFKDGTNAIFIELFKSCSYVKAGAIETLILLSIGKHFYNFFAHLLILGWFNLANCNYGDALPSFLKSWTLDECALLGARLLQDGFKTFQSLDSKYHYKITHHRQASKLYFYVLFIAFF